MEAEATTPDVKEVKNITGLVVKMKKGDDGAKTVLPKQYLFGAVTREGRPVKVGWVGLWYVRRGWDAVNTPILRGRTVDGVLFVLASAPIVNGKYRLEVPDDDKYYVVVEEPGQPLTQIGPVTVKTRNEKKLDIACAKGGAIMGKVRNVPKGWEEHLWTIAFTKTGIHMEARVGADGTFRLNGLPPGEYGVKVGHDAYLDAEVPRGKERTERGGKQAEPWKHAIVVRVEAERVSGDVILELPPGGELPKQ